MVLKIKEVIFCNSIAFWTAVKKEKKKTRWAEKWGKKEKPVMKEKIQGSRQQFANIKTIKQLFLILKSIYKFTLKKTVYLRK